MAWNQTYRANGHPEWPPFGLNNNLECHGTGYYSTYALRVGNTIAIHWHGTVLVSINTKGHYKLTTDLAPSWRKRDPRPYLSCGLISRLNGLTPFNIHSERGWVYNTSPADVRTPLHSGMSVDAEGTCVSRCPKASWKLANAATNEWKSNRNALDRASAGSRRAQERAKEFIEGTRPLDKLKSDDVFKIRNAAHRTAIIEAMGGSESVLASMPTRILHTDTVGNNPYDLVEIMLTGPPRYGGHTPQPSPCKYLKMTNPSTNEAVLEGVANSCLTVRDALRWRDGDDQLEREQSEIRGERFATLSQEYVVPSQLT